MERITKTYYYVPMIEGYTDFIPSTDEVFIAFYKDLKNCELELYTDEQKALELAEMWEEDDREENHEENIYVVYKLVIVDDKVINFIPVSHEDLPEEESILGLISLENLKLPL